MKLPEFKLKVRFNTLNAARERMGAPLVEWKCDENVQEGFEFKEISVVFETLEEFTENVGKLDNGILINKKTGQVIFAYIKDNRVDKQTLEEKPGRGRKVHLAWCRTLDEMEYKKKFDRYVGTNRTSGIFEVDYLDWHTKDEGTTEARLHVCKNCLDQLGIPRFGENYKNVSDYDFVAHVEKYDTVFKRKPKHKASEVPLNKYQEDWKNTSVAYRESKSWICEDCGVDLQDNKFLLDSHHVNGNKYDDRSENLMALCKCCHKEQPDHGHYNINQHDKMKLNSIKRQQGKRSCR